MIMSISYIRYDFNVLLTRGKHWPHEYEVVVHLHLLLLFRREYHVSHVAGQKEQKADRGERHEYPKGREDNDKWYTQNTKYLYLH